MPVLVQILLAAIAAKALGNCAMLVYRLGRDGSFDTRNAFEAVFSAAVLAGFTYQIAINL